MIQTRWFMTIINNFQNSKRQALTLENTIILKQYEINDTKKVLQYEILLQQLHLYFPCQTYGQSIKLEKM